MVNFCSVTGLIAETLLALFFVFNAMNNKAILCSVIDTRGAPSLAWLILFPMQFYPLMQYAIVHQ